jgi:microcystin-dependent protein
MAMDAFMGAIQLVAFNFVPQGWAECNGQLLTIRQYPALFSLLGPQYGGDGRTTFGLPNLASPVSGLHFVIATQGTFPQR